MRSILREIQSKPRLIVEGSVDLEDVPQVIVADELSILHRKQSKDNTKSYHATTWPDVRHLGEDSAGNPNFDGSFDDNGVLLRSVHPGYLGRHPRPVRLFPLLFIMIRRRRSSAARLNSKVAVRWLGRAFPSCLLKSLLSSFRLVIVP